jgi:uncharacterized protein (DUF952 family)
VKTRWIYHALLRDEWERVGESYAPESLVREGFVHASYRDVVEESARLYVATRGACVILRIDPRACARVEDATTPRGLMPHVLDAIPRAAIVEVVDLEAWDASRALDLIE